MSHTLAKPELFTLTDAQGSTYRGADQEWFRDVWQRRAGCGPTTAATVLAYLSKTSPALEPLAPAGEGTKEAFLAYMETLWTYVTPGTWGLDKPDSFTIGCRSFALSKHRVLDSRVLAVPRKGKGHRPTLSQLRTFLYKALDRDHPVAFLNYSNGDVKNLDSWHWVPLIAADGEGGELSATVLDGGEEKDVDLALWLETTLLGGALVTVFPDPAIHHEREQRSE